MAGTHNFQNSTRNTPLSDQNHFIDVLAKRRHLFHHPVKTIHIYTNPIITYSSSSNGWIVFHHKNPQLPKRTLPDPFIYNKVNGTGLDATVHLIFPHQDTVTSPQCNLQSLTFRSMPTSCSLDRTLTPNIHQVTYTTLYRESPLLY